MKIMNSKNNQQKMIVKIIRKIKKASNLILQNLFIIQFLKSLKYKNKLKKLFRNVLNFSVNSVKR